jgi:signal transduction histidine kinase/DNA-binding response OmpR family regulator/CHASE3 domain sensor protein/HAMP domain-containing protein
MEQNKVSLSVVRQLRMVFLISILLLLISSLASFFANRKLIESSHWVNHTNLVIVETERMYATVKEAESAQRGFLLTAEARYLKDYNGHLAATLELWRNIRRLTSDNPIQQRNLDQLRILIDERFRHMQKVIGLVGSKSTNSAELSESARKDINRGYTIMGDLRNQLEIVRKEERSKLAARLSAQNTYTVYTPVLVLLAAALSILISVLAYFRIKADLDQRLKRQKDDEALYLRTTQRISNIERLTARIAGGAYELRSEDQADDDIGRIATALNKMVASLQESYESLRAKEWLQSSALRLSDVIRGERSLLVIAEKVTINMAEITGASVAACYVSDGSARYLLRGGYALTQAPEVLHPGEGLAGEAIRSGRLLVSGTLPADYLKIQSATGSSSAAFIVVLPLIFEDSVLAVLELGFVSVPGKLQLQVLENNAHAIAVALNAAINHERLQELLEETQSQAEELLAQHEELEQINAELETQTEKLQASEEELKVQQEELNEANQELEERTRMLEERNQIILDRNREVSKKAEELEQSTKYKSEFLANMSHELRTPLNSILLLSRLLAENADGSLSEHQVEYATVIQSSGTGLLALIDEILDLSKIEAGKMDLEIVPVHPAAISADLCSMFQPLAREKGLYFEVTIDDDLPVEIETDQLRLEQILRNLIANALKFTAKGGIKVRMQPEGKDALRISVTDTGIGIPPEKQRLIFEAFQQADGSTRRRFGGTGLGLSISKELSRLLGGDIFVTSVPEEGSTFSVVLPVRYKGAVPETQPAAVPVVAEHEAAEEPRFLSASIPEDIPDDRDLVQSGEASVLIVEDDPGFAKALLAFTREKGYKGLVCVRGDQALAMARRYQPLGILLDIQLPVKSGLQVMEELKNDPLVRHIPVHVMSSHRLRRETLVKGAVDFIEKPIAGEQMQQMFERIEALLSRESRKVLIVEDNPMHAQALALFLESHQIRSEIKDNVSDGVEALRSVADCVILDMGIPDTVAYETLETLKDHPEFSELPIIVFTGKSLSLAEEQRIKRYADSIVVKTAHSYQRILDEVSIFLHLMHTQDGKHGRPSLSRLGTLNDVLKGKTVLVVDDDVRNIFSLTKSLEQMEMNVISAIDGKEALSALERHPAVDVVLLDMMMPQMDGYETAREIRKRTLWKQLPVIAVTAKAMTGDRDRCIAAGASDYITKPVDVDQLLSLLRVWLYDYGNNKRK